MKGNDRVLKRLLLLALSKKTVERNITGSESQAFRTAAILSHTLSNL